MDEEDETPLDESRLGDLPYVIANRAKVEVLIASIRNHWSEKEELLQIAIELEHMLRKIDVFATHHKRRAIRLQNAVSWYLLWGKSSRWYDEAIKAGRALYNEVYGVK